MLDVTVRIQIKTLLERSPCRVFLRVAATVLVLPTLLGSASPAGPQPTSPLSLLDGLLGRWSFEDRSTPDAGFDYVERGTRTCVRAMMDAYVVCRNISEGPQPREDQFFSNYNEVDQRFEMIALFSNWGRKMRYDVRVLDGGKRLDLVADPLVRPDRVDRSWATIRIENEDRIVWETRRNRSDRTPDHWPVITRSRRDQVSERGGCFGRSQSQDIVDAQRGE
jgi:hypothetical protein